jgi:hypothetical protein
MRRLHEQTCGTAIRKDSNSSVEVEVGKQHVSWLGSAGGSTRHKLLISQQQPLKLEREITTDWETLWFYNDLDRFLTKLKTIKYYLKTLATDF